MELNRLAIIMDGNGRWAKKRGFPRSAGHREGVRNIGRVIDRCIALGIPVLSLYVLSTENRKRPREEVEGLFNLAKSYFRKFSEFNRKGVKVVVSGGREDLPSDIIAEIVEVQRKTAGNGILTLELCFNYGGKREIIRAAERFAESGEKVLTEESFERFLYNKLPPVDFIIRTGGEMRLSNFLLYQSAYAELYFTDVLWPDFSEEELDKALTEFGRRKRNFGKVDG